MDQTVGVDQTDPNPATQAPEAVPMTEQQSADLARAQEAGWTNQVAFDYDAFQSMGGNNDNWHGAGQVYEWRDEYGDVAPRVPELEAILFGGEFQMRRGEHLANLELQVTIEGAMKPKPFREFQEAGLHPVVMENINLAHYARPTPIQCYVIPAVNMGLDVVGVSQTGSGKTAAYLIPIVSKLMGKARRVQGPRPDINDPGSMVRAEPLVVIVVPTRELAMQIFDEARRMCYRSMLRPCVAYGGLPMRITREELGKGCDVLIATPGRLGDLMDKPHILTMSRVKYTVIDEADEMLHSDWEDELRKIMSGGDTNEDADHTFLMFSATFPKDLRSMAKDYMRDDFVRIRIGRAGSTHKNITQNVIEVDRDRKRDAIYDLLFSMEPGRTFIFCNSKITVDLLDDFLYNRGLPTTSIHSDRNQREREDAMRAFRTGKTPILIATGVSARGWDIMAVRHVINYDLPSTMYGGITEYVHRIGRTGRIGHRGLATSFYDPEKDEGLAQDLVNVLVECDCDVPDFLSHLTPEDTKNINFDDNSEDEGDGGASLDDTNGHHDAEDTGANGFTNGINGDHHGADASAAPAAEEGFTPDAGEQGFTPDAAGASSTAW